MLFLKIERPLLYLVVVKNEFNLKTDPEICFILLLVKSVKRSNGLGHL